MENGDLELRIEIKTDGAPIVAWSGGDGENDYGDGPFPDCLLLPAIEDAIANHTNIDGEIDEAVIPVIEKFCADILAVLSRYTPAALSSMPKDKASA